MKINGLGNSLSFTAGKVHVYSDFDGTYCPEKHSAMHKPEQNPYMVDYCNKMNKFFKSTKGDLDFHITTGRTYGEFEAISWLLKIRDYRLPLPKSVITKNGSDEFVKKGSDADFYDKGKYPYDYNKPSKVKENKIKHLTNWDGEAIKQHIKSAAQKACLQFIEAESENSTRDYGNMSLFSHGKLNPDEWKKLPLDDGDIIEHEHPKADFVLGSRKDGNLKFHLVFPPDYGYCPIRNWIYDNYMDDVRGFLADNNVKYFQSWEEPSHKNHYRRSTTITPLIEGGELTKVFDTKNVVNKAIKNNDLVIVAGDGSNDFKMLNPLEYISQEDWQKYAEHSNHQEFYQGDMKKKLRDLRHIYRGNDSEYINELRDELNKNGFLKQLEDMPFVGIIIRKDNSKLQKLADTFASIGKIVVVDKGNIDEGIRLAIQNYAKQNTKFENNMSIKFKDFIFN